jgi:hypothetical protein
MFLFDKFNEENFEVDNQELDIQPTTFSEIKKAYSQLGSLEAWTEGEQIARFDGMIISRTYKKLTFETKANDFDLIDSTGGYTDPVLGVRYWRVLHRFSEKEYYSECSENYLNFKIWEENDNFYQMEIIYKHEILTSETWERPIETGSNPGLGCPSNSSVVPEGETGPSNWEVVDSTIDSYGETTNTNCVRYQSLEKPFYLIFKNGKALGATIKSNLAPSAVYISSTSDINNLPSPSTRQNTEEDPHRLNKEYLIIKWDNPGKDSLKYATVDFYGVENYRSFMPIARDTDPLLQEHYEETPYLPHAPLGVATRYKPVGMYNVPDNFWNDTNIDEIENFSTRTSNPSRIP